MLDRTAVFQEIIESQGSSLDNVAKKSGIGRKTLMKKLKNENDAFTLGEINSIIRIVNMDSEEILEVFFDKKLSSKENFDI